MAELTEWAGAVCAAAVICAVSEILLPDGSVAKTVKFVLGLFLIVSVMLPLVNMLRSCTFDFKNIKIPESKTDIVQKTDNLSMTYGKSIIQKLVTDCLDENSIRYEKTDVIMDSSDGKSIDIIRVCIYIRADERNSLAEIQRLVKEKTGITPDVYVR